MYAFATIFLFILFLSLSLFLYAYTQDKNIKLLMLGNYSGKLPIVFWNNIKEHLNQSKLS